MIFCAIPPTQMLPRYGRQQMSLILAHMVMADKMYADFYRDRRIVNDSYIILDNSAYELQTSVSIDTIISAAQIVKPHEIVLPDVLRDAGTTLTMAREAAAKIRSTLDYSPNLMAVPQGRGPEEWIENMREIISATHPHIIGIPVLCGDWEGGRERLVKAVPDDMEIHLLGWESADVCAPGRIHSHMPDRIRSIDSAKPIIAGIVREHVDFARYAREGSQMPKRPAEYFDMMWSYGSTVDAVAAANIKAFREFVGNV